MGYPRGARSCSTRAASGSSTVCALGLPGVRASVSDTPDGVKLSFSSVGRADELRKRTHEIANGNVEPEGFRLSAEAQRMLRKVHLSYVDEPIGITIFASAIDPNDIPEIRSCAHGRFERAQSNQACD
jgi:hypothetical protein